MARTVGAHSKARVRAAGEARQQAWQSMRVLRRFTTADLLTVATIGESNVRKFVRGLARTGYLALAKAHVSGRPGSLPVWQLVRDTGPKCPIVWTDGRVHDVNTDTTHEVQP